MSWVSAVDVIADRIRRAETLEALIEAESAAEAYLASVMPFVERAERWRTIEAKLFCACIDSALKRVSQ